MDNQRFRKSDFRPTILEYVCAFIGIIWMICRYGFKGARDMMDIKLKEQRVEFDAAIKMNIETLIEAGKLLDNEKVPKENRTLYTYINGEWKMTQTDEFGKVKPIKQEV